MDFRGILEQTIIELLDTIEEFFTYVSAPTASYIVEAFVVSLGFFVFSVIEYVFDLPAFILPQEALICSVLLAIVAVVDTTTRQSLKKNVRELQQTSMQKLSAAEAVIRSKIKREDGEENDGDTVIDREATNEFGESGEQ